MTLLELPPVALPLLWHYGLPVAPHLGFFSPTGHCVGAQDMLYAWHDASALS